MLSSGSFSHYSSTIEGSHCCSRQGASMDNLCLRGPFGLLTFSHLSHHLELFLPSCLPFLHRCQTCTVVWGLFLPILPPSSVIFHQFRSFSQSWVMSNSDLMTVLCQAFLSTTNSQSLLKLVSIEIVTPSKHLILLSSSSPPAFDPSQYQGLFHWVSSLRKVAKVLELQLQHQSFQWTFRTDFL